MSNPTSPSPLIDLNRKEDLPTHDISEDNGKSFPKSMASVANESSIVVTSISSVSSGTQTVPKENEAKISKSPCVKKEPAQSFTLPMKRPELYSGLGPWDFLIDRSNIPDETEEGFDCKSNEYHQHISKQKLEEAIKGLEDIILKFKKVIEETCSFDKNINKSSLSGEIIGYRSFAHIL